MAMSILTDYGLNVSPKFICWCPGAQSDGIRKWVLGRCFGHVGGAIMNEASVLIGGLGIPFPFYCHMMIQYRKILGPRRSPSPHHADILILEIQSLKLWEIDFFCKLHNLWDFVGAAWTKTLFNYMFLSYSFLKINVKKWHCYFKAYGHI